MNQYVARKITNRIVMFSLMIGVINNGYGAYSYSPTSLLRSLSATASSFKNLVVRATKSMGSQIRRPVQSMFSWVCLHPQKTALVGLSAAVVGTACWFGWQKFKKLLAKSDKVKGLKKDLKQAQDDHRAIEEQLKNLKADFEQKKNAAIEEIQKKDAEIKSQSKRANDLDENLTHMVSLVDEKQVQLLQEQAAKAELEKRLNLEKEKLSERLQELTENVETLTRRLEELSTQNSTLTKEKGEFEQQNNELREENRQYEQRLVELDSQIIELGKQIADLLEQKIVMEQTFEEQNKKFAACEAEINKVIQALPATVKQPTGGSATVAAGSADTVRDFSTVVPTSPQDVKNKKLTTQNTGDSIVGSLAKAQAILNEIPSEATKTQEPSPLMKKVIELKASVDEWAFTRSQALRNDEECRKQDANLAAQGLAGFGDKQPGAVLTGSIAKTPVMRPADAEAVKNKLQCLRTVMDSVIDESSFAKSQVWQSNLASSRATH